MAIPFLKMQGIGNDYVYIDATERTFADENSLAVAISDRHFGVGSDGLIFIKKATVQGAKFQMQMHNSDGSLSEMCGNGLRCVAKFLFDRGMETSRNFPIQTGAGNLIAEIVEVDEANKASKVRINMGEPRLERGKIPMTGAAAERAIDATLEAGGKEFTFTSLSMGNPHCVIFTDDANDDLVLGIGPKIEHHEFYPNRTNVLFVEVLSRTSLKQRTWERGAGETLACGTGASAVCVAGVLTGRSERKVEIELLGGKLELEWRESDNCVYKTGPAVDVFTGEWPEG